MIFRLIVRSTFYLRKKKTPKIEGAFSYIYLYNKDINKRDKTPNTEGNEGE